MDALLAVCLAIIAVNALLQAALVIGLAIGVRRAAAALDEAHQHFDRQVKPTLEKAQQLTANAVLVSDGVVDRARKLDAALADATDKLMEATDRVSAAIAGAAERVQVASSRGIPQPRGRAFAILRSLWRAAEVWSSFDEEPEEPRRRASRR
jgi:uncharacterized protein YoxC